MIPLLLKPTLYDLYEYLFPALAPYSLFFGGSSYSQGLGSAYGLVIMWKG